MCSVDGKERLQTYREDRDHLLWRVVSEGAGGVAGKCWPQERHNMHWDKRKYEFTSAVAANSSNLHCLWKLEQVSR